MIPQIPHCVRVFGVSIFAVVSKSLVVLTFLASNAAGQTGRLTGRVVEAGTKRPLPGARVTIVETGITAIASRSGTYSIQRPEVSGDFTVRVTLLGFAPQNRLISASFGGTVDFILSARALGLDEVVVTGTGGPARVREVGHSIAQIDVSKVPESPVTMDNLLAGKVPGLNVMIGSGLAGAGSQIRLRGNTSVALSNQPLIYLDGVRIRSDGYPVNAPQTGNRLRAANEVPSPINDIDPADVERIEVVRGPAATTLYGTEAATGVLQIFTKRGGKGNTVWTSQVDVGADRVQRFGTDTEPYMRLEPWLKTAPRYGYAMSASGGGTIGYYASAGYDRIDGVLPNDSEKRLSVRGNFDFEPAPKLILRWSSAFSRGDIANTSSGANLQGFTFNAYRGPTNPTGTPGKESIDRVLDWKINTALHHLVGGLTASYAMTERMSHSLTLGYDRAESDMRSLRPFGFVFAPGGILSSERWSSSIISADYLARAGFDLTDRVNATLAFGGQVTGTRVETVAGYSESFAGPGDPTLNSGAISSSFEARTRGRTGGAFTQLVLGFSDRLFVTGGVRLDGNSAFGRDFGVQPYPRLSASWVISENASSSGLLGAMKLRAAYGHAGRAPRSFDAQRTWSTGGFDGTPAYTPLSVGNARLGPETTAEMEFGLDGTLLGDRATFDFSYYRRTTRDALFPVTQPASLGFLGAQLENVGTLHAAGLEASLTASVVNRPRLSWTVGLDVATNRSEVKNLGRAPRFVIGDYGWIIEGKPAPAVRSVYVTNATALEEPIVETGHVYGPNMPTHTIGTRSSLRFGSGIELSARAEYTGGNFILDNASRNLAAAGAWPVCDAAYAAIAAGNRSTLTAWQRLWCNPLTVPIEGPVWPADFARLRALTIAMPVPGAFFQRRSAMLSVSARNIMLWKNSDMPVFDPEMSGRDGMNSQVRTIEMQVPPSAGLVASLRATWW